VTCLTKPSLDYYIALVLRALRSGPLLASEMPHHPNATMVAESHGLCRGDCIERSNSVRSTWRWSITAAGRLWLKAYDAAHGIKPDRKPAAPATYRKATNQKWQ